MRCAWTTRLHSGPVEPAWGWDTAIWRLIAVETGLRTAISLHIASGDRRTAQSGAEINRWLASTSSMVFSVHLPPAVDEAIKMTTTSSGLAALGVLRSEPARRRQGW